MPRGSNGTYTLPESAFILGTVIRSAPVNSDLADIATALTQSLATTGVSVMTGVIKLFNGTVAAPGLAWADSLGTGWYRIDNNVIGFAVAGVLAYTVDADRILDSETGFRAGNIDVFDPTVLDWYEEGTFVPVLSFEGDTSGITYAERSGRFSRIGNLVSFSLVIVLSDKGDEPGDAFVSGLPYPIGDLVYLCELGSIDDFGIDIGTGTLFGRIDAQFLDGDAIGLYQTGSGESGILDDGDLTDNSAFRMTGFYRVA